MIILKIFGALVVFVALGLFIFLCFESANLKYGSIKKPASEDSDPEDKG